MKKHVVILCLAVLLGLAFTGCGGGIAGGNPDADTVLAGAEVNYEGELDANSPEGLAQASANVYKDMINGVVTPDEGFDLLLNLVPPAQAADMEAQRSDFTYQIQASRELFASSDNVITGYVFSKTYADEENAGLASIYRVQNMKDGNMYFFRQDFVKDASGTWSIRGDNLVDDFAVEKG